MKKLNCIFLLLVLWILQGCKGFVEGYTEDPNNPADAPLVSVLNAAFTGMIVPHEGHDARVAGMWTRQFSGVDRQYSALEVYNANSEDFQWEKFYLVVENAEIAIEKASVERNELALGIAKIVKAHQLGTVASLYGDIPMAEATRFPDISDPAFDGQLAVYAAVQALLDEAIAHLSGNLVNTDEVEAIDFYFHGDAAAWTRVANSLKARYLLHTGKYAEALAFAAKGVTEASQDWMIPHTNGSQDQDMNIYFNFGQIQRAGYMDASTAYLPTLLDKATATYRGNAKTNETARFANFYTGTAGKYDLNYDGAFAPATAFPVVTAVEMQLIAAECQARLSDPAQALAALNKVRSILQSTYAAGKYEPYALADFDAGGMANRQGQSAAASLLYEIIEEKYCSLVSQIEVFNDLRRTDNLIGLVPTKGSQLPERYLIPQVEIDANSKVPNPLPTLFQATEVNK